VLRISGGQGSALLVGDIERAQEVALLERLGQADAAHSLRSTVLLAPHHGSKTSSSAEFLAAVQPAVVLVQSGYRNRYGHPAPEVMVRYRALAATYVAPQSMEIIDSPHCGAFAWHSGLPHNGVCARAQGQRYWHHRVPPGG
jgi:competence protein ComEC